MQPLFGTSSTMSTLEPADGDFGDFGDRGITNGEVRPRRAASGEADRVSELLEAGRLEAGRLEPERFDSISVVGDDFAILCVESHYFHVQAHEANPTAAWNIVGAGIAIVGQS